MTTDYQQRIKEIGRETDEMSRQTEQAIIEARCQIQRVEELLARIELMRAMASRRGSRDQQRPRRQVRP